MENKKQITPKKTKADVVKEVKVRKAPKSEVKKDVDLIVEIKEAQEPKKVVVHKEPKAAKPPKKVDEIKDVKEIEVNEPTEVKQEDNPFIPNSIEPKLEEATKIATKHIIESKTIWVNAIMLISFFLHPYLGIEIPMDVQGEILTIINIYLRIFSDSKILIK